MKVFSWGANNTGQLGHGYFSEQVSEPTEIDLGKFGVDCCTNSSFLIQGGGSHTVIYCPVSGTLVHLGLVCTKFECQSVTNFPAASNPFLPQVKPQIAAGWDFSLFISPAGELYSCGDNSYGQLGLGVSDSGTEFKETWSRVLEGTLFKFTSISAGMRHAGAITHTGELFLWGDNSKGQIGKYRFPSGVNAKPICMTSQLKCKPKLIRCTKMGTIILSQDNKLYGTGETKFGLYESTSNDTEFFPELFPPTTLQTFLNGHQILDVQTGWNHVLMLLSNGTVGSFGRNNFGQLGRKLVDNNTYDACLGLVENLPEKITQIACGSEHNMVLGESGTCYSFGWNEHDNCGVGIGNEIIWKPTKVPIPNTNSSDNEYVVSISCGAGNSFAITKSR